MADDSHSDEVCRFLFAAYHSQPKYTSAVCECKCLLVWTRSWTADKPRVEGWEFVHCCYLSCKQLMRRHTEAGYTNMTAPNINPVNNILCWNIFEKIYQVKDFITRTLDVVVYNLHSRPITVLGLRKKTFQNRICANH